MTWAGRPTQRWKSSSNFQVNLRNATEQIASVPLSFRTSNLVDQSQLVKPDGLFSSIPSQKFQDVLDPNLNRVHVGHAVRLSILDCKWAFWLRMRTVEPLSRHRGFQQSKHPAKPQKVQSPPIWKSPKLPKLQYQSHQSYTKVRSTQNICIFKPSGTRRRDSTFAAAASTPPRSRLVRSLVAKQPLWENSKRYHCSIIFNRNIISKKKTLKLQVLLNSCPCLPNGNLSYQMLLLCLQWWVPANSAPVCKTKRCLVQLLAHFSMRSQSFQLSRLANSCVLRHFRTAHCWFYAVLNPVETSTSV